MLWNSEYRFILIQRLYLFSFSEVCAILNLFFVVCECSPSVITCGTSVQEDGIWLQRGTGLLGPFPQGTEQGFFLGQR